jgi:3alpha(or 20beta)-hydroxysteroid dehydrogenase
VERLRGNVAERLRGNVVIVTGAAQGMGRSHVEGCVAEGARVVFTDVQTGPGAELAEALGDAVAFVEHDVTDVDGWARVVATAVERFGRLDGLVNNAAIYPKPTPILEEDPAQVERVFRVNVMGTWHGIRAVAPVMRAGGGGSIVNISSLAGMRGYEGLNTYGMSKWAVRGLTKTAARELGPAGIRVNSVHPGGIDRTGMFTAPEGEAADRFYATHPLRRAGQPEEVTGVVIHLLSEQSSYVTGMEHVVDGGSWT